MSGEELKQLWEIVNSDNLNRPAATEHYFFQIFDNYVADNQQQTELLCVQKRTDEDDEIATVGDCKRVMLHIDAAGLMLSRFENVGISTDTSFAEKLRDGWGLVSCQPKLNENQQSGGVYYFATCTYVKKGVEL